MRDTEYYRVKLPAGSRALRADRVDRTVVAAVARDLVSTEFVARAAKATRAMFEVTHRDDIDGAHGRIAKIEGQIARLLEMAADLKTPAPVLRKVDALEDERTAIEQQVVAWQKDDEAAMALHAVTDAQVRTMMKNLADEMAMYDRLQMKDFLASTLDRMDVDPVHSTLQLHYRVSLNRGNNVASPRGFEPLSPP